MAIVAHTHPFVVGVDTHARNHVLAILAATGEVIDAGQFPTTAAGMARAIAWAARRTGADLATLWVIEGVASYGAGLAALVERSGHQVVEAARMNARANHGIGKSDPLDAQRIAAAVLALDTRELRRPRLAEGVRAALRVLVAARDHMTAERTATLNALIALLRVVDLGIDARKPVSTQIATVARRRARDEELGAATARAEAIRPAKRVLELDEQVSVNSARTVIWRRPAATWNMSWTTRRSFGRASPPRTSEGSSTPSTPGNEHPPALNGDRPASVDRKAGWNPVLRLTGTRRNGRATDFATPAIRAGRSPGYSAGMILDCGVGRACAPVGARPADGRSNARSPGYWYIAA